MTRITVLGLGAMGQRMARRLITAGHAVTVWNRSPAATDALRAAGARVATTPREGATDAEVVVSMVYDDAASRHVWLDADTGAAAALPAGALAIETSTLTPAWVQALHADLLARGVDLVDAPVAGSRSQAEAGQLIFLLGGRPAAVDAAASVLAPLGAAFHRTGGPGSGAWLKLAVNTLFGVQVAAMAEVMGLLRGAGVEPEGALAILRTMPVTSPAAAGAAVLMLAGNYTPQAPVDLIAKDLGYVQRSAAAVGRGMPMATAARARYLAASAAGHGGENLVAVARLDPIPA